MRIVVDNGHSFVKGADPGVISPKGQPEGKTNFNVAEELVRLLKKQGHQVIMTNPLGVKMSINERVNIAVNFKANVCISVHHNGGGGNGAEVWAEWNDKDSMNLAVDILSEFKKLNESRGVKTRKSTVNPSKNYFGLLNVPKCINVITEFAFLDSADIEAVDTLEEQKKEAAAIAEGVAKFHKKVIV